MSKTLERFNEIIETVERSGDYHRFSHKLFMDNIMNDPERAEESMKVATAFLEAYGFLFNTSEEYSCYVRMRNFVLSESATAVEYLKLEYQQLIGFIEEDLNSGEEIFIEIAGQTIKQAEIINKYIIEYEKL